MNRALHNSLDLNFSQLSPKQRGVLGRIHREPKTGDFINTIINQKSHRITVLGEKCGKLLLVIDLGLLSMDRKNNALCEPAPPIPVLRFFLAPADDFKLKIENNISGIVEAREGDGIDEYVEPEAVARWQLDDLELDKLKTYFKTFHIRSENE